MSSRALHVSLAAMRLRLIAGFVVALSAAVAPSSVDGAAASDCEPAVSELPAVKVEYETAGAAVGIPSALSFEASDDGTLRARDFATGQQMWAFRSPEAEAAPASRGLMTKLAVLRFDANGDGVIDARNGDRVWLYFGLKRAGAVYYALDVTDRTPRVLWRADSSTLEGLGDAWSPPTIARVRVGGARQNGEHFVVIVGGGMPSAELIDAGAQPGGTAAAGSVSAAGTDESAPGNRLFMLDAASGYVLWSAGNADPVSFIAARMTASFASRIVAIDFDGDQFADRLYAADVGARIWRFDIWNGKPADALVTGGVFASLGSVEPLATAASGASPPTPADARKFFNSPDLAYSQPGGEPPYYGISIGSGDADLHTAAGAQRVQDRFYSLHDRAPFARFSQTEYDAMTPIFDSDLTSTAGLMGWKRDLAPGERVLSDAVTVNGTTLFSTFQPDATLCAATGTNRVYAVKAESGRAALDLDGDTNVTDADIAMTLEERDRVIAPRMDLIAPAARPDDWPVAEAPSRTEPGPSGAPPVTVVRTFWMRTTIN